MASGCLARISSARRALAEAKTLDDVLRIRDEAEAVRHLLKVQGESLASQNEAAEVKIRAERLLGESLAKMEKAAGGRPTKTSNATLQVSLGDLGIQRMQSHRWQTLATVPEDEFERHVAEANEARRELTTVSVYRLAKRQPYANGKPEANGTSRTSEPLPVSAGPGVVTDLSALAGQKFGTIYADPPWSYSNTATRANVSNHYAGTMTAAEVAAMPVGELAADDAHLHLWVTKDFIFEAKRVMDAWGFEYKSMFVWVKTQMGIGNYWRMSHEMLLLGVRGNAKRFNEHKHKSWAEYPRGEHSAKPEEIRGIIERCSPGGYLELFGRKHVPGWTVFGNQVDDQRRLA
jgi:N6-adenosine-specific RNA methylase IME4